MAARPEVVQAGSRSANAHALQTDISAVVAEEPMVTEPGQGSLFPRPEAPREKIVRMKAQLPLPEQAQAPKPEAPRREALQRAGGRIAREAPKQTTASQPQQEFAFFNPDPQRVVRVETSSIYCKAPVAMPVHRMIATAVDTAMVLLSLGLFLGMAQLVGMSFGVSKPYLIGYGAGAVLMVVLYRLLWCVAEMDSIGTRAAGLKMLNFDGEVPDRRQRLLRFAASLISIGPAGLGLLWALADEEKLTWHDHISKTFPTPALGRIARRRYSH
ncbi:MAG: RDD family protein [Bryobacterales bacterium]|nr:RDD family protein [Bryobacterales bacterium]